MNFFSRLRSQFTAARHESDARDALARGHFREAAAHAQAIYEFDLENPWANFLLACQHLYADRYMEALAHFARVRQDWPQDACTHFAIGLCHDYLEQHREAVPAYETALSLMPDWTSAQKNLGRDLYLLGDYPQAETMLRAYCATAPEDREAHDLLGYMCYRQGDYLASFNHYESARRLDPMNVKMDRNARLSYMKSARS